MYGKVESGRALFRLRDRANLTQTDVAKRLGCSKANVAAWERRTANPKLSTLVRYLDAIGATLADLDRELAAAGDALDEVAGEVDERIEAESGYRQEAAELLAEHGTGDPGFRKLAELIMESEKRYREELASLGVRIEALEDEKLPADGGELSPNGTED